MNGIRIQGRKAVYAVLCVCQILLGFFATAPLSGVAWLLLYIWVFSGKGPGKIVLYIWGVLTVVLGIGNLYAMRLVLTDVQRVGIILVILLSIFAMVVTHYFFRPSKKQ